MVSQTNSQRLSELIPQHQSHFLVWSCCDLASQWTVPPWSSPPPTLHHREQGGGGVLLVPRGGMVFLLHAADGSQCWARAVCSKGSVVLPQIRSQFSLKANCPSSREARSPGSMGSCVSVAGYKGRHVLFTQTTPCISLDLTAMSWSQ